MEAEQSFLLAVSDGSEMVAVSLYTASSEALFLQLLRSKASSYGISYFFRRKMYECALCEWMELLQATGKEGWMLDDAYLFRAKPLVSGGICWEEKGVVPGGELV